MLALQRQLKRRARTSGQLFSVSDANRDNKLTFAEFCTGVAAMGIRPVPSESELRQIFDLYDTDGNGWIDWEELKSPQLGYNAQSEAAKRREELLNKAASAKARIAKSPARQRGLGTDVHRRAQGEVQQEAAPAQDYTACQDVVRRVAQRVNQPSDAWVQDSQQIQAVPAGLSAVGQEELQKRQLPRAESTQVDPDSEDAPDQRAEAPLSGLKGERARWCP